MPTDTAIAPDNFIHEIIEDDLDAGKYDGVVTRFPPEPNGYPHIGHAKSIVLNFGTAAKYGGRCHLRMDDTNPTTEDPEYVASLKDAVRWLGYDWGEHLYHASDYFEQLYALAVRLIKQGDAYVDSLSEEEIRAYRGTVTEPGRPSPYRDRSVEENLDLFERMRRGEFEDGAHVLRAKIDMAHPNMKMRDPLLYRIRHAHHYRTGDAWHVYPFYDFAHGLSDAIEGITHSLCTLEFEANRAIYDWLVDRLFPKPRPYQFEFARLNLDYTVMSKRKLKRLVEEGQVSGWDDPRMPTIAGMKRRGVTPEAVRAFCEAIGVTKTDSRVDVALLEHAVRDDLNYRAPRVLCVQEPLRVVLTNFPEDRTEQLDAPYWPHDVPNEGSRTVPFDRELYIEHSDFAETPPKGWRRLAPGVEVRLRHAYVIRCDEVVKNDAGDVVELRCTYLPETRGGDDENRKVNGTIHWVSAAHSLPCEVRLYDRLFRVPNPDAGDEDFTAYLNPDSIVVRPHARVEPSVLDDAADTRYQFERQGYFWRDPQEATPDLLIFNRIVPLRDSWGKRRDDGRPTTDDRKQPAKPNSQPKPQPQVVRDPAADLDGAERLRFDAYVGDGLDRVDAATLATNPALADFFDAAVAAYAHPQTVANWTVNDLRALAKTTPPSDLAFDAAAFARLVELVDTDVISTRTGRDVLAEMADTGAAPDAIVEKHGWAQVSDADALAPTVQGIIDAHPDEAARFRAGEQKLIGFFIGQLMRATGGTADPKLAQQLLREKLAG